MKAIHEHEGKWWFWDEVWANRIGPYDTEGEARMWIRFYADYLSYGKEAFIF